MVFHLDYGEKQAFNDLEGDQCRAWIRREHYNIRGDQGEVYDDEVYYMEDFLTPVHYSLERMMTGAGTNLEGSFLRGVRGQKGWVYENPFRPARMFDDEIAVATLHAENGRIRTGWSGFLQFWRKLCRIDIWRCSRSSPLRKERFWRPAPRFG